MVPDMADIAACTEVIEYRAPGFVPRVGLVLGSGLGGLTQRVGDACVIPYADLPGFPRPTVQGHAGRLVVGRLAGVDVACFQGRQHLYEGQGFTAMTTAIRTVRRLGAEILLLTCAAGSLRPEVGAGRLMAIADHINLLGRNPLTGDNDDSIGPRFLPLADAWDARLRRAMMAAARRLGIDLAEGVYAAWLGPTFETPAEVRMMQRLGVDACGMSTVPDCIVARHCGLRVAGIAVITNLGTGLAVAAENAEVSHEQTLRAAAGAATDLERLIVAFLKDLDKNDA